MTVREYVRLYFLKAVLLGAYGVITQSRKGLLSMLHIIPKSVFIAAHAQPYVQTNVTALVKKIMSLLVPVVSAAENALHPALPVQ